MFQTFINAFKIKDIRKKILITLLLIVVYRLGCFIPIPGVNTELLKSAVSQYDILGFLDLLTGSSFSQFTIFAMGISPYINASIIMQLLTIAIPALERMNKEEDGRKKIERITRYTVSGWQWSSRSVSSLDSANSTLSIRVSGRMRPSVSVQRPVLHSLCGSANVSPRMVLGTAFLC